jgi:cystathionine gamma-lyase
MTQSMQSRAASLIHLRGRTLETGDPVPLPLVQAATFHTPGESTGVHQYGRFSNPTWDAVEEMLTHLEGAKSLAFPSGMAAIAAVMFALLKTGDRVLLPADGYHTTRILADRFLTKLGISVDTRPTATFLDGGFEGYRLVFVESPSNPNLDICDITAVAAAAHAAGAIVVVDNTTMTPYGQRPLELGADIVVAADTKAPNGHSDALFGHVASRNEEIMAAVHDWRTMSGSIPSPFDAWLVHRGLETLEVRFDRMCSSAETIARRLKQHPAVQMVRYPGLEDDPSHNLARARMERFGFLVSLVLATADKAEDFINGCPLMQAATSFGSVHTSAERRNKRGDAVAPGFVRIAVGCEPVEELWAAIEASLDRVGA